MLMYSGLTERMDVLREQTKLQMFSLVRVPQTRSNMASPYEATTIYWYSHIQMVLPKNDNVRNYCSNKY